MKQVNDTHFKDLAEAAFLPGDSDGMWYGGAQWKINNNMMLQGGYNRADNLLDMGWVDLDMVHRFDKDRYVRLDVQYLYETANGKQESRRLLHEQQGRLSRSALGAVVHTVCRLRLEFAMATSCARRSASGRRTWCSASARTRRQGEKTWILGSTFDFSTLGARGLAFDVSYG